MKSGFIFSITAMYYALLFVVFIGLFIVAINIPRLPLAQETLNIRTIDKLVSATPSSSGFSNDQWCAVHIIAYDANTDLTVQTNVASAIKKYCEDYNGKRII